MSPRPAATRPFLGTLALAFLLALTACAGDQPEDPTGKGAASPASGETTAEATEEPTRTAADESVEPTGTAPSPTGPAPDEPPESPSPGGPEGSTAPHGPDGSTGAEGPSAVEGPAADGAASAARGGTGGSAGVWGSDGASRWCTPSQLEVTAAPAGGAAGSVWVDLTATNTGGSPCTLAGYPGVSFVDSSGAMLGAPAARDTTTPGTGQVVAPGQSVSAALRVSQAANHPACDARGAAGLRVYPPESTESVMIPFPAQACADARVQQLEIQGFGT